MALRDVFLALGLDEAPAGVLWDMDGTIVDTETEWAKHSKAIVEQHGGVWTEDDDAFVTGASTADHAARLAQAVSAGSGRVLDVKALFEELSEVLRTRVFSDIELLPGAAELIRAFADAHIPQALVTATPEDLVLPVLTSMRPLEFDAVVTGSDDVAGKPDPAPYLLGADRLGVRVNTCIAFEDSTPGLTAARRSGARAFSVAEFPVHHLTMFLR